MGRAAADVGILGARARLAGPGGRIGPLDRRPVLRDDPIRRDMSIAVEVDAVAEDLGDRVRASLGEHAKSVEEVLVLSDTAYHDLPPQAIERLGLRSDQKNVLLRVVLRDLDRTLTHGEANQLRDRIYAALHQGSVHSWASVTEEE